MLSETDVAGAVKHEYFMASQLMASRIVKLLSVARKPCIKQYSQTWAFINFIISGRF